MLRSQVLYMGLNPELKIAANDPVYPVIGTEDPVTGSTSGVIVETIMMNLIYKQFVGLLRGGQCLEKAVIGKKLLPLDTNITIGGIEIIDPSWRSSYKMNFNPPIEVHAWLTLNSDPTFIIDFSLPGLLERASLLKDDIGYFVQGRPPAFLAGQAPDWLKYSPRLNFRRSKI